MTITMPIGCWAVIALAAAWQACVILSLALREWCPHTRAARRVVGWLEPVIDWLLPLAVLAACLVILAA